MTEHHATPPGDRLVMARAADVLAAAAHHVLGPRPTDTRVGEIALRPHQRGALTRVRARLARHGGALLADEVGLGKTFVALALMRDATSPLVVAPAALRGMWTQALARAGLAAPLVTMEALSRGRLPATRPDLLVVDEAHHVRTPRTRRYDAVAALATGARILLVTATPIHNRPRDLAALLALFAGESAYALDEGALARHVVRQTRADLAGEETSLPCVDPPRWLPLAAPDSARERAVLDAIVGLPPAVPPADGGDAGALLLYGLVRQWASSRAALRGALRRRLAAAGAMLDALDTGRTPTRGELSAWTESDGVVQLAFAELLSPAPATPPRDGLRDAVVAHADAVRRLLARLAADGGDDPDGVRADALRAVRRLHPGERVIAFAERAETVTAYFTRLNADGCVAALTAGGGRVAGGPCSRADVLRRFAPRAHGLAEPPEAERIALLLTTDLLSEGVNLQDASVVVHLDMPWNPARIEQRVGRVRRLGAARDRVTVYFVPPPVEAERLLHVEQRLRAKLGAAARTVGVAGAVLPSLVPHLGATSAGDPGEAAEETRVRALLEPWRDDRVELPAGARVLVGACRAGRRALLALVREHGDARLVAVLDGGAPTDAHASVRRALEEVRGADRLLECRELRCDAERALAMVEGWLARRAGASIAGLAAPRGGRSRRRVLERIATLGESAPRHRRSPLSPLLAEARRAASAPLGVGAERVLEALAASELDDESWLRAVATFGRLHAPGGTLARARADAPRVLALLLLR